MVSINPGIIAVLAAAQVNNRRRNQAIERDRTDVTRETCLRKASSVLDTIVAERHRHVAVLVEQQRAKRQARNRWLPRWFQFSLEDGVILESLAEDVYQLCKADSALVGACRRLVCICETSTEPTVSVTKRDWRILECYRAVGSIAPHLLRE